MNNLKTDFSARFDRVLAAIEETWKGLADCTERMTQVEVRLVTVEDKPDKGLRLMLWREKINFWKIKRYCLNNLRLVNLPEGAEGPDPRSFLENWILEVLDPCSSLVVPISDRKGCIALVREEMLGPH